MTVTFSRHGRNYSVPENVAGQMLSECLASLSEARKFGNLDKSKSYHNLQILLQIYVYSTATPEPADHDATPSFLQDHSKLYWNTLRRDKQNLWSEVTAAYRAMIKNMPRRDALVRLSERHHMPVKDISDIVDGA